MSACTEEVTPEVIDSSQPQGVFTATATGDFVEQNGAGSTGSASLGTDEDGATFLQFNSAFNTNLATGTVTVYLSTSAEFTADPGNGNPDLYLVGAVRSAGENNFKLDPVPGSEFTHVILWCGSANVPFGYAELQ
ncbi:MAG: DM13 domain-containing protein [Bacteroidota bacterium]